MAPAGGRRHAHAGAPQRVGLTTQRVGRGMRGARHGQLALMLLGRLPGLQQIGGFGIESGHDAYQ